MDQENTKLHEETYKFDLHSSQFAPSTPNTACSNSEWESSKQEEDGNKKSDLSSSQESSVSNPSPVQKDKENGIDPIKTPPQKKPKRKKHRPKVVREGVQKKTPKSAVKEKKTNEENVDKEVNGVDQGVPEETKRVKRSYVRRKNVETSKTPSTEDVDREVDGADQCVSEETKTVKRSYVRRKNAETSKTPSIEDVDREVDGVDQCVPVRSCRRSLNFDLEGEGHDPSPGKKLKTDTAEVSDLNLNATQVFGGDYFSSFQLSRQPTRRELLRANLKILALTRHDRSAISKQQGSGRNQDLTLQLDLESIFENHEDLSKGCMDFRGYHKKKRSPKSHKSTTTSWSRVNISDERARPSTDEQHALAIFKGDNRMVPYDSPTKKKLRPKVALDPETIHAFELIMGKEGSEGDEKMDGDYWQKEWEIFHARAESFIARMHLIQGDRRFSPWHGSVVDSVVGVYLTQNVLDTLSSSAFLSLAARFPVKPIGNDKTCHEGTDMHVKVSEVAVKGSYSTQCCEKNLHELVRSDGSPEQITLCEADQREHTRIENKTGSFVSSAEDGCSSDILTSGLEHGNYKKASGSVSYSSNEEPIHQNVVSGRKSCQLEGNQSKGNQSTCSEIPDVDAQRRNKRTQPTSSSSQKFSEETLGATDTPLSNNKTSTKNTSTSKQKAKLAREKIESVDWDLLRKEVYEKYGKKERTQATMDSVDWDTVRLASVDEVAKAIEGRGQHNVLAKKIKEFLQRIFEDHESIDLEWLRDVSPNKAKDYLLSIHGLGLKSVECIRLLTLRHHAFPVDTNIGRIAVRLGWVPLEKLLGQESPPFHLLEQYPLMDPIQIYLWPRLCTLDKLKLYELHYQMITFGKVFCTKSQPNCNACPMRAECKHFASAYASTRLLPGPEEKRIVSPAVPTMANQNPVVRFSPLQLPPLGANMHSDKETRTNITEPIVELPTSPEPECPDIEDLFSPKDDFYDPDEIPIIKLNVEDFALNLQNYVQENMSHQVGDVPNVMVSFDPEGVSVPAPKLKNVIQLRTEHQVYELPDSHPLLEGAEKRFPGDDCSYLLAIWTPGETAESIQLPERCGLQTPKNSCGGNTCVSCSSTQEGNSETVKGTILIPCKTTLRGSFPLNGTYFQVNEVFADHESSLQPIDVPRADLWNLPRRTVYCGPSIPNIFKGQSMEQIQRCFWKGYVCVRAFDRISRIPHHLTNRLHCTKSKFAAMTREKRKKRSL